MHPFQILLLAILVIIFQMLVFCWWWLLILQPTRSAWKRGASMPLASSLALQFTLAMVLLTTALGFGGPLWILAIPLAWPTMWLFSPPSQMSAVALQNAGSIAAGLLMALLVPCAMFTIQRHLVRYSLIPCVVVGVVVTLLLAEQRSTHRMQSRAKSLGVECLARHTLRESLAFWGEEFQPNLHATARIEGDWHGWSYRDDDFYLIPDAAPKDGNGLQAECLNHINRWPSVD